MLDLWILTPAETLPQEAIQKNAFLWMAEAKPLPPASPSDDDAQEIVVDAGTPNELRLLFDAKETDLAERVAGVCNSFYVSSGKSGVEDFHRGILETGWRRADDAPVMSASRPAPKSATPEVRGEQVYVNAAATPKRHALSVAVDEWSRRLEEFSKRVVERVQTVANQFAKEKLEKSLDQTLRQAYERYFRGVPPGGRVSSGQLVVPGATLTGPDVSDLADAMTQIATLARELGFFREQSYTEKRAVRLVGLVSDSPGSFGPGLLLPGIFGPGLLRAALKQDLRGLLETPSASSALAIATQGEEAVMRVFAEECARLSRKHPVLIRLWDQPIVFEVADLWNNTPATQRLAALAADGRLADALANLLNNTSAAANDLIAALRANPKEIWRYDNAIHGALQSVHLNEGDIAWRAAEDYLLEQKGVYSDIAKINMGLGVIEWVVAAAASVAPPVTGVLAMLSGAAGVVDVAESFVIEASKDRAFEACLDPAESIALEGGSYVGVVVSALFMLFGLRGIGRDVAKGLRAP
jgi:hypothetical protein